MGGRLIGVMHMRNRASLNGFGKFKVKNSPAREGRNPATGAAMQIAASRLKRAAILLDSALAGSLPQ